MSELNVQYQASLKHLNTFGFDAIAEQLVTITDIEQLFQLERQLRNDPKPLLILGGGSNLVLADAVPGVVARIDLRRWEHRDDGSEVLLWAGAGEGWHETVERTLAEGWFGLENLALIPGTVGAAPVQNIGAYGVELKDRVNRVEVFDRQEQRVRLLDSEGCRFAYRDSLFKTGEPGRYIITAVEFRLSRKPEIHCEYAALKAELEGVSNPVPEQVFAAVCRVRRHKLPMPGDPGNVGSFFKNPVVSDEQCRLLVEREPELVFYPDASGGYKLAAGWLIERCGLRGYRMGAVGTYPRQALVLVNWGGGARNDIETLAAHIQGEVRRCFGVELEPEPRFYP